MQINSTNGTNSCSGNLDKTHLETEYNALKTTYDEQVAEELALRRPRSAKDPDTKDTVMTPTRFGVVPVDGSFDNVQACDCGNVTSAIRKSVKANIDVNTTLGDVTDVYSDAFKQAKILFEDLVRLRFLLGMKPSYNILF